MVKPFFSIIIPALNEEKYLPHLLSDLVGQSYRDFEVIVVDGKSDDQTVKRARSFSNQLPALKIITSPRRHVCVQRNLGAKHAHANWFVFMDADNRLPPYFLQGLKYRLESSPADVATCYLTCDSSESVDQNIAKLINLGTDLLKKSPQPKAMESLLLVSRPAFVKIGGFDEQVDFGESNNFLQTALDLDLSFRVYRDPVYTYSFRRFRSFGKLNSAGRSVQAEFLRLLKIPQLKPLINKLYPMQGGQQFTAKRTTVLERQISKLLDLLRQ